MWKCLKFWLLADSKQHHLPYFDDYVFADYVNNDEVYGDDDCDVVDDDYNGGNYDVDDAAADDDDDDDGGCVWSMWAGN